MGLETLKFVDKINGFELKRNSWIQDNFIEICEDQNSITFKIQNGPIKENGVNGCQLDTLIYTAKIMLEGLAKTFPCRENSHAITNLEAALHWLDQRTKDRQEEA